jgi:hypothetical protein
MSYRRRPFLKGNTDSHVLTQPYIDGSEAKSSTGEFTSLVLSAELCLETETAGPTSVVLASKSMASIVAAVNATMAGAVIAEDVEGVLRLSTAGSGQGAFIRVRQAILGGPITEAARILGFPVHPNPTATVSAAAQSSSPVRPRRQKNTPGSAFLGHGEDRVASAYNRALEAVAGNSDALHTMLSKRISAPLTITVSPNVTWAPYLTYDANGDLDQINLSALSSIVANWGGKLYVGGLTRNSTLARIATFWAVHNTSDQEIPVADATGVTRTLRVSAVTRGLRGPGKPAFASDNSLPTGPLANTSGVAADGLNALGVARVKQAAVPITAVDQRTLLVAPTALFDTNGVDIDDVVTISGSAVGVPFNHDGSYLAETVVSETQLIVRSADTTQLGELNPDDSAAMGNVSVSSDGLFEEGLYITLDPPFPRFQASGGLKLTFGIETRIGELPVDVLLRALINSAESADSFVMRELWQKLSLGTAYDGVMEQSGSGFAVRVTNEAATFISTHAEQVNGAVVARTGVGLVLGGAGSQELLRADPLDNFTTADLGKTVLLTGAPYLDQEPVVITRLIDKQTVEIIGGPERMGIIMPSGNPITYEFMDSTHTFRSALSVVLPTSYGLDGGSYVASPRGISVQREQLDTVGVNPTIPGLFGYSQLEQVRLLQGGTNIARFTVTFDGTNTVFLPFDPETSANIMATATDTKGGSLLSSLLRIVNGPYAGYYRVGTSHSISTSVNSVEVLNLDGTTPAFPVLGTTVKASFYSVAFATKLPLFGIPGSGASQVTGLGVFHDGIEDGNIAGAALTYGWRGTGGGIRTAVNDAGFVAFDAGEGASGSALHMRLYPPASSGVDITALSANTGSDARRTMPGMVIKSRTFAADWALASPTTFSSYGAWFSQRGKDPSVVVTKTNPGGSSSALPATMGDFVPSGALVVARQGAAAGAGAIGRSGAVDIMGSLYSYRGNGTFDSGGIYTEDVMGAGKALYPTHSGKVDPSAEAYDTDYGSAYGRATELGHAGQVYPVFGGSDTFTLDPPDFATFNYNHTAVYYLPFGDIAAAGLIPSSLIGCTIKPTAGIGAPYLNSEMTIVGYASSALLGDRFAVKHPSIAVPGVSTAGVTASIKGSRWYHGHVDVADWMQIGTSIAAGAKPALPALTVANGPAVENSSGAPLTVSTRSVVVEGLLTTPYLNPTSEGEQVGRLRDLAVMPNMNVIPATYVDGWQRDAGEPRAPFANVGIISSNDGRLIAASPAAPGTDVPGHLQSEDYALQVISGTGTYGLAYADIYGGSLMLESTGTPTGPNVVRIWQKGMLFFPRASYSVKVRVTMQSYLTGTHFGIVTGRPFTIKLVFGTSGTTIATSAPLILAFGTGTAVPQEFEETFELSDLFQAASDRLAGSITSTSAVYAVIDVEMNSAVVADDRIHIMRMQVEQLAKPAFLTGGLDAIGTVRARTFRHIVPVRGHETVGPASVRFLSPLDYAKYWGNHVGGAAGAYNFGQLEGKGVGGISRDASSFYQPIVQNSMMFHQGVNAAAIRFYAPYFDPLWYVETGLGSAAAGTTVVGAGSSFVLPGRTGFTIPLNPPHGSRLTGLGWSMSFSPCYGTSATPASVSNFQIWRDIPGASPGPALTMDSNLTAWRNKANWDAAEGVQLTIWRQHVLEFGTDYPLTAPNDDSSSGGNMERNNALGTSTPSSGYAETIFSKSISLAGVTEPIYTANANLGTEHPVIGSANLQDNLLGDALAESRLRVDRRHFAYFATFSFYGGLRSVDGQYTYVGRGNPWILERILVAGLPDFDATHVSYPINTALVTNGLHVAPFAKFRGARLSWTSDRAGNGGW